MTKSLRAGVIGVGHLGKFHAAKYSSSLQARLVAVADVDRSRREALGAQLGCRVYDDYRALLAEVDVVSIVVPAREHYAIARECLRANVDVLLEKPMAVTVDEASELVELAAEFGRVLQIGHLERFNPAVVALRERLERPQFIEVYRIAPFQPRGTDISVVLDLMIHDIDLLLALVGEPIVSIDANGSAVLTNDFDIVNARLRFAGGCVANVTASRVSMKSECQMRLFQRDTYFSLDLRERQLTVRRKGAFDTQTQRPSIDEERLCFDDCDLLRAEIDAFLHAVGTGSPPLVSGEAGLQALETALEIVRCLEDSA